MRRFVASAVLALIVLGSVSSVASAAPHRPAAPARAQFNVCDHDGDVWTDGPEPTVGDIQMWTAMQWRADASGGYCGQIRPIAAFHSAEGSCSSESESVIEVNVALYTQGGSNLGGYTFTGNPWDAAGCSWHYTYGPWINVDCNTTVHSWGAYLENTGANKELNGSTFESADGDDVSAYEPLHDICVN